MNQAFPCPDRVCYHYTNSPRSLSRFWNDTLSEIGLSAANPTAPQYPFQHHVRDLEPLLISRVHQARLGSSSDLVSILFSICISTFIYGASYSSASVNWPRLFLACFSVSVFYHMYWRLFSFRLSGERTQILVIRSAQRPQEPF